MTTIRVPIFVNGIPAQADVFRCEFHKGDWKADNPDDYHDNYDLDYKILDKNGRRANWLEEKADSLGIRDRIEEQIIDEINAIRKRL